MLSKVKKWFKREYLSNPYEKVALVVFGITYPIIIVLYVVFLLFLRSINKF